MSRIVGRARSVVSTDGLNPSTTPYTLWDGNFTTSTATMYSLPFLVESTDRYRFAFVCPATGSPVGSVKLQACIDPTRNFAQYAATDLVNWTDLDFDNGLVSMPINGATTIVLDENFCNYPYVRMVMSLASGSIAPTIGFQTKGDGGR